MNDQNSRHFRQKSEQAYFILLHQSINQLLGFIALLSLKTIELLLVLSLGLVQLLNQYPVLTFEVALDFTKLFD